jgi:AcrR family transcriptional regulator
MADELRPPRPLLSARAEAQLSGRHRVMLDELEDLFLSAGFASSTMRDLAAHLRCSLRTLYEIAPSKQELVLLVLDRFFHRVGRNALAAIDPGAPVAERIRSYFGSGVELQRWTVALAEDSAGEAEILRLADRHFTYVNAVLEQLIAEGVSRREMKAVDPKVAAAALGAAGVYLTRPDVTAHIGRLSQDVVDEALDIFLLGLSSDSTR